jgi:TetR/AcrR family transcriptional repressor of mexJK operon
VTRSDFGGRPSKAASILPAAKDVFFAHGYESATMDEVAAAAGVSKTTLYAHFPSKESLFIETVKAGIETASATIEIPDLFTGDIRGVLIRFTASLLAMFLRGEGMSPMTFVAEFRAIPDLASTLEQAGPRRTEKRLERLLSQVHASGELHVPDPATSARHLHSLAQGRYPFDISLGLPRPAPADVERHVVSAVDLFVAAHRQLGVHR